MFISPAFAQDAAETAQNTPSVFMSMLPLLIIFVLFYLLVIRPQSKRIKEHGVMLQGLKAGDKVITGGGVFGVIKEVGISDITVEIAPGVNIKSQKHTITALQPETDVK